MLAYGEMVCQTCGLDKKILQNKSFAVFFGWRGDVSVRTLFILFSMASFVSFSVICSIFLPPRILKYTTVLSSLTKTWLSCMLFSRNKKTSHQSYAVVTSRLLRHHKLEHFRHADVPVFGKIAL